MEVILYSLASTVIPGKVKKVVFIMKSDFRYLKVETAAQERHPGIK